MHRSSPHNRDTMCKQCALPKREPVCKQHFLLSMLSELLSGKLTSLGRLKQERRIPLQTYTTTIFQNIIIQQAAHGLLCAKQLNHVLFANHGLPRIVYASLTIESVDYQYSTWPVAISSFLTVLNWIQNCQNMDVHIICSES